MPAREDMVNIGSLSLHIRDWQPGEKSPDKPAFVLLHGLSSNARTWDFVAQRLAAAGYRAVAVDQRGHGLSDHPDDGYDFETITTDLQRLIGTLQLQNFILAGQSWGGNVVLYFGARFPQTARALIFVDGGFINLAERGSWEEVARELRPPDPTGLPRATLAERIAAANPRWIPDGVAATLHNLETLPDGTMRPRLTLERHMRILRTLYEQNPATLYPQIEAPVLICAADDNSPRAISKRNDVAAAERALKNVQVVWFADTAHDIHVDRPAELVGEMLAFTGKKE